VACLLGLAGYLHSHGQAVAILSVVAGLGVLVIVYDVGYERGRTTAEAKGRPEVHTEPRLTIETGNGFPWDVERIVPTTIEVVPPMKDLLEALGTGVPATATSVVPLSKYCKQLKVRNHGPGVAIGLRVQTTNLDSVLRLPWEGHRDEREIDLAPGEDAFLALDLSPLGDDDHTLGFRVFAKNVSQPVHADWVFSVRNNAFPYVRTWDEFAHDEGYDESEF
jgi:hypothetical protein